VGVVYLTEKVHELRSTIVKKVGIHIELDPMTHAVIHNLNHFFSLCMSKELLF